ncbi:HPP family protein [Corynebacterium sp. NML120713]|uniref:CBS domain-containing protein n=1 Tax=Corynebacterium sp. NML120713 TaxID=1906332 RepID=UPI0021019101|nr:CBS domain-containing protein [Corynebacterium sp. NML120713]
MQEDIYALSPNDTIRQALHMFVDKRISGVPLLDHNNKLASFVSDGDVLDSSATPSRRSPPRMRCSRTTTRRSSAPTSP